MDELAVHASTIYALTYLGSFVVVSLLEFIIPRRDAGDSLRLRWFGNVSIAILNFLILRMIFPTLSIGVAALSAKHGWGLFHSMSVPLAVEIMVTLIVLDAAIYAQHYLLHHVSILWRLHRAHHSDQNFDFTTGLRFHPLEGIIATAINLGVIAALGSSPAAVLIAQLTFTIEAFLGHANIQVPASVDLFLRRFVVTPDMHRIHHSEVMVESQSNFGNIFSWWDRLFGTYIEQPSATHERMIIGLPDCRDRKWLTVPWMLLHPFLPASEETAEGHLTVVRQRHEKAEQEQTAIEAASSEEGVQG